MGKNEWGCPRPRGRHCGSSLALIPGKEVALGHDAKASSFDSVQEPLAIQLFSVVSDQAAELKALVREGDLSFPLAAGLVSTLPIKFFRQDRSGLPACFVSGRVSPGGEADPEVKRLVRIEASGNQGGAPVKHSLASGIESNIHGGIRAAGQGGFPVVAA